MRIKIWERAVEVRIRSSSMDHSEKELDRFDVCFESVDREV